MGKRCNSFIFLCSYHYVRILLIRDTGGYVADEPTSLDIGGRLDEQGHCFRNYAGQNQNEIIQILCNKEQFYAGILNKIQACRKPL